MTRKRPTRVTAIGLIRCQGTRDIAPAVATRYYPFDGALNIGSVGPRTLSAPPTAEAVASAGEKQDEDDDQQNGEHDSFVTRLLGRRNRRWNRPHRVASQSGGQPAARSASHSARVIAYSTSPSSSPGMRTGHSAAKVRTYRRPAFSITRREPMLTAIVSA